MVEQGCTMFDDISFLVQETFKDAEQNPKRGFFSNFLNQEQLPESSGVLFHLQQNDSTFVVRILPSKNLRSDFKNIKKHPDLFPNLRLDHELVAQGELRYYECDSYQLACSLKNNLANKRFPVFEENVFNVSDPGDSWWMGRDEDELRVYFKLSRTEKLDRLVKLGPLGDRKIYENLFLQMRGYFQKLFPLKNFSSGHGQITIKTDDPTNANFQGLMDVFEKGLVGPELFEFLCAWEMSPDSPDYLDSLQKANFTLIELATLRGFWVEIENLLNN